MRILLRSFGAREIVATLGIVLVGVGLGMIYLPAALVGVGGMLVGLAVLPLAVGRRRDG